MKVGDLVRADTHLWPEGGKVGIVVFVQPGDYCVSAQVLFDTDIVLIRLDNLNLVNESNS